MKPTPQAERLALIVSLHAHELSVLLNLGKPFTFMGLRFWRHPPNRRNEE